MRKNFKINSFQKICTVRNSTDTTAIEVNNHKIQKRFVSGIIFLAFVITGIVTAHATGMISLGKSIKNERRIREISVAMEREIKSIKDFTKNTVRTLEEINEMIDSLKNRVNIFYKGLHFCFIFKYSR